MDEADYEDLERCRREADDIAEGALFESFMNDIHKMSLLLTEYEIDKLEEELRIPLKKLMILKEHKRNLCRNR